jgi:hypothetical protein
MTSDVILGIHSEAPNSVNQTSLLFTAPLSCDLQFTQNSPNINMNLS